MEVTSSSLVSSSINALFANRLHHAVSWQFLFGKFLGKSGTPNGAISREKQGKNRSPFIIQKSTSGSIGKFFDAFLGWPPIDKYRLREFVRWLIEKQLTQQIDGLDASGTEAVPSDTPRTQLQTAKQSAAELSTDQPQDNSVGS